MASSKVDIHPAIFIAMMISFSLLNLVPNVSGR